MSENHTAASADDPAARLRDRFPSAFTILFALIVIVAALTRIVPAGQYERVASEALGMDMRLCGPKPLWPDAALIEEARDIAKSTGARLTLTEDVDTGVRNCDYLYTDVWVSMCEPDEVLAERIDALMPYQVNTMMRERSGYPDTRFMQCLPAFHNTDTEIGALIAEMHGLEALEVTDDVFESPASIVFDQAENRMHTIKAVLVATLGG